MESKLGVHHGQHNGGITKPPVHHHHHGHGGKGGGGKGKGGAGCGGGGKGIKVVYISSPMKLTASAEEFRAIVQELTGRDSNVADHDVAGAPSPYYPSSFGAGGRTSYSPTAGAGPAAPPTMATASPGAGRAAAEYAAAPPPFQSVYDQTAGRNLLYGQDYYW